MTISRANAKARVLFGKYGLAKKESQEYKVGRIEGISIGFPMFHVLGTGESFEDAFANIHHDDLKISD